MLNKKSQVSDVMTWVVATIIIVVIMIVFIYASSVLAQKTKIINAKEIKIEISEKNIDWTELKTSFAYSKTSEGNKQIINAWRGHE